MQSTLAWWAEESGGMSLRPAARRHKCEARKFELALVGSRAPPKNTESISSENRKLENRPLGIMRATKTTPTTKAKELMHERLHS